MKDGPISKLLITETGHRLTQYKKIVDTLLVLCAGKDFRGLNEVIRTELGLAKLYFMPTYLDGNLWSTTYHVQVSTVNQIDVPIADDSHPARFEMKERTHIFDVNLQKKLLLEYK